MSVPPREPAERASGAGEDCRCSCGSLLARLVDGHVEIKCRRCRQTVRIRVTPGDRGPRLAVGH